MTQKAVLLNKNVFEHGL